MEQNPGWSGAGIAVTASGIAVLAPDVIENNKAYSEQTIKDREALEKYAPKIKNGKPLTIDQGVEFIYGEHDNNPREGKISITEAMDVLNRVKRYETRTYQAWNESSKNLFEALMNIDKKQSK